MSGIYIKGMEMPKHCWQCPFHDDVDECILLNQSCMVVWGENKRLEDCPLIEAPEQKHGKWIYKKIVPQSPYMWKDQSRLVACSICNVYQEFETLYCPNCGARMDGES